MKKLIYAILPIFIIMLSACEDRFLDLDPKDTITDAAYFKTPQHFKAAANDFYNKMISWRAVNNSNVYDFMDFGSDLVSMPQDYGRGVLVPGAADKYWTNTYSYIRSNNILLEKAEEYEGDPAEIAQYVAAAKFFRAWHHFFLIERFGGVPIVTEVLDLDSPELHGKRNSRYEVIDQVLKDLSEAIPALPQEQSIAANDKGHLSRGAAKAFKARVLLYEATWEKYVGTSTDGDGATEGAGSVKPQGYPSIEEMLTEAVKLSKEVIESGAYELWDYNSQLENLSSYYLFNLEDEGSNPAGLTKSTNREYILYNKYDYDLLTGNINLSHTVGTRLAASRKFMDMFLSSDGLPISQSPLFQGYVNASDEFKNRDYRLSAYFEPPTDGAVKLMGTGGGSGSGYDRGRKFAAYDYGTYRAANTESPDYPQIRLAEVYLIYAEALFELNGSISDAQLDESINKTRARAGLPPLSNAFVSNNGLDMLEEIRRERAVELFAENTRFNDLKRWGKAEELLNAPIVGSVIEGTAYEGNTSLYNPNSYPYGEIKVNTGVGERNALLLDPATNRNFQRKHYLFPIPLEEINLNPNLLQNPYY